MADPSVSIVVASNGAPGSVEACLAALSGQLEGAEVLVQDRPGALVPELWRDGIDAAQGAIVALTISPMRPAPDWVARIRERRPGIPDADDVALAPALEEEPSHRGACAKKDSGST